MRSYSLLHQTSMGTEASDLVTFTSSSPVGKIPIPSDFEVLENAPHTTAYQ